MESASELRLAPRRYSRGRLAFFRTVEGTARLLGGRGFYRRRYLSPDRLVEREERLAVPGLPAELDGFTFAQLSDIHAGPFLRSGDLAHVVDLVNRRAVDVCALTGDFVTHHWSEALELTTDLARLEARLGKFAVFGNHDYKDRAEDRIRAEYEGAGVRFLRNEGVCLARGGASVGLLGLEDLEEGKQIDLDQARKQASGCDVEVVLCHNPHGAPAIAREGCRAVLSGHTHGSQVDLPLLRTLGPPHPGLRVELGETTLIVSRGVGVVGIPFRHGSPAEIVYIVLERGDAR